MRGTILDADSFDRGDLDTTGLENALDHWSIIDQHSLTRWQSGSRAVRW